VTDNLRDRIAAVQAKHLLRYDRAASSPDPNWWCQCGGDCLSVEGSHSQHVADAVISEMGLRQEWGALDDTDSGSLADTREELGELWPGETLKVRHITDWAPDGQ
jgi:hypothetical protein